MTEEDACKVLAEADTLVDAAPPDVARVVSLLAAEVRRLRAAMGKLPHRFRSTGRVASKPAYVRAIVNAVADRYKVTMADIMGERRYKELVEPRGAAMYLARRMTRMSYPDLGAAFEKHHTTVMSAVERMEERMQADSDLRQRLFDIEAKIRSAREVADG